MISATMADVSDQSPSVDLKSVRGWRAIPICVDVGAAPAASLERLKAQVEPIKRAEAHQATPIASRVNARSPPLPPIIGSLSRSASRLPRTERQACSISALIGSPSTACSRRR